MRRTTLLLGAMLAALVVVSGVAWAANIQCQKGNTGHCLGTQKADVIIGTSQKDIIDGQGGADLIRAGRGADYILGDDYWFGEDENHGGPGADHIVGNFDPEKHFGGRGDDLLVDEKSDDDPEEESDVFNCGPGHDEVFYNEGLDRVADDCEVLHPWPPASKGTVTPE
jgi:Ca2+-binding RTX toxin-like protein